MNDEESTEITGSFGRDAQGRITVEARGSLFFARALPPAARVGRIPVMGLLASRGVLKGTLLGTPQPNDELMFGYPPEPEIATGVRFNLPSPPAA